MPKVSIVRRTFLDSTPARYCVYAQEKEWLVATGSEIVDDDLSMDILERVAIMAQSLEDEWEMLNAYNNEVLEERKELEVANKAIQSVLTGYKVALTSTEQKLEDYKLLTRDKLRQRTKQCFRIPNDDKGKEVVSYLRDHVQKGKKVVLRGRKHKNGGQHVSVALKDAEQIGIYVEEK